ncbi:MAG: sulfatase, partial [Candidatus Binatia bacterium]
MAATLGLIEAACLLWRYPHTDIRDGLLVILYGALGYALAAAVVARLWMLVRPARWASSSDAAAIGIAVATLLSLHQLLALVLRHDASLAWLIPGCVLAGAAGGGVTSVLAAHVSFLRSRALWRSAAVLAVASGLALAITAEVGERRVGATLPGDARAPAPGDARPNVLLISIDTLRADHLGAYGRRPSHTPSLDGFAAGGALFERAASPIPLTGPSHTTMLTGVYPARHGARSNGVPLRRGVVTVPELLGRAGYRTAAFVSGWPLKNDASGLASHFRHYDEDFALSRLLPSAALRLPPLALPSRALRMALGIRLDPQEREGERTVGQALAWLGRADPRPFFAFVHLYEPHNPYAPPRHYRELLDPAYTGSIERFDPFTLGPQGFDRVTRDPSEVTHVARLYEAEVAWVDALIGTVLDGLAAQGVADSTLVTVTADHGESMTEHGEKFGHSDYLYETMTHVPLLLRFPQGRFAG